MNYIILYVAIHSLGNFLPNFFSFMSSATIERTTLDKCSERAIYQYHSDKSRVDSKIPRNLSASGSHLDLRYPALTSPFSNKYDINDGPRKRITLPPPHN